VAGAQVFLIHVGLGIQVYHSRNKRAMRARWGAVYKLHSVYPQLESALFFNPLNTMK
jgi:hypothetical protein